MSLSFVSPVNFRIWIGGIKFIEVVLRFYGQCVINQIVCFRGKYDFIFWIILKGYVVLMWLVSIWSMFNKVSIGRFWLYFGSFVGSPSFKHVVYSFQIFLGLGTILKNWVEIRVHFRILKTVVIGLEIGNLIDMSFYLKDQGSYVF